MENKSKEKRVLELERSRTASDKIRKFCPCRCHIQRLDFRLLKDSTIIRFAEILHEQMDDSYFIGLEERRKNTPPCMCKCIH